MRRFLLVSLGYGIVIVAGCGGSDTHGPTSSGGGADAGTASGGATASSGGSGGDQPDGGPIEPSCGEDTFEYPARSGLCVDDPCKPDPCGGQGSCSNLTGAAVCTPCTYFVDATGGQDTADGKSSGSAWKTTTRVNAAALVAGDNVCFKRGETFAGPLTVSHSGTAAAVLRHGSYGEGAKPMLSGFSTLSSWTEVGGGVWKSACPACGARVSSVAINGASKPMGRTPNADAPGGGYLTYEGTIGTPSVDANGYYGTPYSGVLGIVDDELPAAPDWTGAEVVIRKIHYVLERARVTSHQGHDVMYANAMHPAGNLGLPGWGYFFHRSLAWSRRPCARRPIPTPTSRRRRSARSAPRRWTTNSSSPRRPATPPRRS
jgi:hypothetical protein